MFRVGILLRALPSILGELLSLVWHGYKTGDRRAAAAALLWFVSTVALLSFGVAGVLTALGGGEVQLRGPVVAASLPIAMWLSRELASWFLLAVGWLLSHLLRAPADASR